MTKRKFIKLTEQECEQQFRLVTNPYDDNVGWNGCFFETYGQELEYVRKCDPACIWTYIDGEERDVIVSGYHLVNCINYLISIDPIPDGINYEVELDVTSICTS